ncbi:hypothetical protein [Cytobacillus purgationiresistens]|uniref:Lipoprotein n=1 Tax=Cytobacillus purgationiresistens TaxID=863449 RepID=A0ABU0AR46_9BACI|nr:hypothetical protein [Cytobacillus purgationiresistens]MDQ0273510.1 hypothetical protein [Cytobacillus purgationiresistens]
MLTKHPFKLVIAISLTLHILPGCMSSKVDEKIQEVELENSKNSVVKNEETNLINPEQQKAIDNMNSKDAHTALSKNKLDKQQELKSSIPAGKDEYKDPEELSQYLGNLFYLYHSEKIEPKEYLDHILQHAHAEYKEKLPKIYDNQLEAVEILQELYIGQLREPIESYVITELNYQDRVGEATFYRKYTTRDNEEIFSITVIKKDGDVWKLLDDSPAAPYEVSSFMEYRQEESKYEPN